MMQRSRILVVDDDSSILAVVRRILQADHDVTLVAEASEALALFESGRTFHLILCDLHMPGMSGVELQGYLRLRWPEQANRVVLLTGDIDEPAARGTITTVPRLAKPFSIDQLRQLVAERLA